jgi:hypothetical protein
MKKQVFLLYVFFIFTLTGCITTPPFVGFKPIKIEEVVIVPNKTKVENNTNTRQWFSNYFTSRESVIDSEDKDSGTIIGKGIANNGRVNIVTSSKIKYKIKVDTKENKVRIVVSLINYNISLNGAPYEATEVLITEENQVTARSSMEKSLSELKAYILSKEDSSDW